MWRRAVARPRLLVVQLARLKFRDSAWSRSRIAAAVKNSTGALNDPREVEAGSASADAGA